MKNIIKYLVGFSISAAIISLLFYYILFKMFIGLVKTELNDYNNMLGKDVIFKSDTLTIVDYSILKNVYISDEGKELNMDLVKKLEIVEKK